LSDWKRTTQEIPFENLRPELRQAIHDHIEKYELGAILSNQIMCVQTISEKAKKGLFGSAEIAYAGIVLTPRWIHLGNQRNKDADGRAFRTTA